MSGRVLKSEVPIDDADQITVVQCNGASDWFAVQFSRTRVAEVCHSYTFAISDLNLALLLRNVRQLNTNRTCVSPKTFVNVIHA